MRLLKAVDPSAAGLQRAQVTLTHVPVVGEVFQYKNNNKHN